MYVIIRAGDGKFVSMSGMHNSYTRSIRKAEKYPTREQAKRNCCGNEYVVGV